MKNCNCCGGAIDDDFRFTFDNGTTFCGDCYYDYFILCLKDAIDETVIFN